MEPFVFDLQRRGDLASRAISHTELERSPLARVGGDIVLLLPTAVGAAVRRYVVEWMGASGYSANFEAGLAREYRDLIRRTPLLGGKARAPLPLQSCAGHRIGEAACEIDNGHLLHLIFIVEGLDGFASDGLAGLHPRFEAVSGEVARRITNFP